MGLYENTSTNYSHLYTAPSVKIALNTSQAGSDHLFAPEPGGPSQVELFPLEGKASST